MLNSEADVQEGRKGVRELQNAEGGDEAGEVGDLGNRGCHDEGKGPVDRDDSDPAEFASATAEVGKVEVFHEELQDDISLTLENEKGWIESRTLLYTTLIPMFPYSIAAMSDETRPIALFAVCHA